MPTHRLIHSVVPILLPAMLLAQVGCSGAPTSTDSTAAAAASAQAPNATKYDGEQIFRGVFFGEGAVAALFPETWHDGRVIAPEGALGNAKLAATLSDEIARMKAEGKPQESVARLSSLHDALVSGTDLSQSADYGEITAGAKVDLIVNAVRGADPTFFESFGADMRSGDHVRVQAAFRSAQKALQGALESADLVGDSHGGALRGNCAALYFILVIGVFFFIAKPQVDAPRSLSLDEDELVDRAATRLHAG